MSKARRIGSFLGLVLTLPAVLAQDQEAEPDPLYLVEVIIFAQTEGNPGEEDFRHGTEIAPGAPLPTRYRLPSLALESLFDSELPEPADEFPLSEAPAETAANGTEANPEDTFEPPPGDSLEHFETFADDATPGDDLPAIHRAALPGGFRAAMADELELGDIRRRMDNLRAYRVLAHTGWVQSGVDTDRSLPLDLRRLGISNPAGTIELYLRRFLHLKLDLTFRDGAGSLWSFPAGAGLTPLRYADSYRLVTERNAIRSGELHFVDHPLFGVLVSIRPAPEPEDADGERRGPAG